MTNATAVNIRTCIAREGAAGCGALIKRTGAGVAPSRRWAWHRSGEGV
jgi:hypothetical protein